MKYIGNKKEVFPSIITPTSLSKKKAFVLMYRHNISEAHCILLLD